jgi:predicted Rossmann fold nucleotide-binding protein DprA/Smf involved in DNA uptake
MRQDDNMTKMNRKQIERLSKDIKVKAWKKTIKKIGIPRGNNIRIIGIVGNRYGWGLMEVLEKLNKLDKEWLNITQKDIIVSGGALGVDTFAQIYAKKNGIPFLIIYPDPEKPSPDRFFERNKTIAEVSDVLIAFNHKGARGGTYNTIRQFKKMKKKIIIYKKEALTTNEAQI